MSADDERLRIALTAAAGGISLARAARVAGLSLEHFMELASAACIPVLTDDQASIEIDLQSAANFVRLRKEGCG